VKVIYSYQNIIKTVLVLQTGYLLGQSPSALVGKWKGEDKPDNHSEFFLAKDGFYYGKLIYEGKEKKNLGKILFHKLKYDATTKTFQGSMSPPDADLKINATISFFGKEKLKVVVKKFMMTKTIYLLRLT
jgi:hypothetical protein